MKRVYAPLLHLLKRMIEKDLHGIVRESNRTEKILLIQKEEMKWKRTSPSFLEAVYSRTRS